MGKTAAQALIERGIERGIEQGIEQGIAQGIIQSKQEDLLELMQVKFGSVPQSVEEEIKATEDVDKLTSLFRHGLTAKNIDEMGIS